MRSEQSTKSVGLDWNQPVTDEQFEKEMLFDNDEISIDTVDFDSVNPRDVVDVLLGEAFARD
jgi:hypothetical protein